MTIRSLARACLILIGALCLVVLLPVLVLVVPSVLPVDLPKPSGPWPVGRTRFELDVPEKSTAGEKILLWLWYPAERGNFQKEKSREQKSNAPYLPQPWQKLKHEHWLNYLWGHQSSSVHTNSFTDAAFARGLKRLPILLMMPGLGASVLDYQVYCEELASHGYVVIGIAAPDSEPLTALANGKIYGGQFQGPSDALLDQWAGDMIFVLNNVDKFGGAIDDQRGSGDASNQPPETSLIPPDSLDLTKVGAFGHSFGGAAAIEACALDPRFKAAADLDGHLWSTARKSGTNRACMIVHGQPFKPGRIAGGPVFDGQSDKYLVTIAGSRHFNYSDNGMLMTPLLKVPIFGKQILGDLDGKQSLLMNRSLLLSFFDHSLKGLPAPYLESNKDQELQIQHFKPGEKDLNMPSF